MDSISEKMVYLRKAKKLTQEDISEMLNISRSAYANFEKGNRQPSVDFLMKLAQFYNVSLDFLVNNDGFSIQEKIIKALVEATRSKKIEWEKLGDCVCNKGISFSDMYGLLKDHGFIDEWDDNAMTYIPKPINELNLTFMAIISNTLYLITKKEDKSKFIVFVLTILKTPSNGEQTYKLVSDSVLTPKLADLYRLISDILLEQENKPLFDILSDLENL